VPTPTCFGTKVPLSGSFSEPNVCRSNKYLFQALLAHTSIVKVESLKMLKLQITHPQCCNNSTIHW